MAREVHPRTARACAVFIGTLGVFSATYTSAPTTRALHAFTAALAHSVRLVLRGCGMPVRVAFQPVHSGELDSYVLVGAGARLVVADDCNGVWAFVIFLAAVLAVPSRWHAKALGLGLGLPALWIINVLRVLSLYYIAVFFPSVFVAAHLYVWQFLIIGAGLLLLALWVAYCVEPADA